MATTSTPPSSPPPAGAGGTPRAHPGRARAGPPVERAVPRWPSSLLLAVTLAAVRRLRPALRGPAVRRRRCSSAAVAAHLSWPWPAAAAGAPCPPPSSPVAAFVLVRRVGALPAHHRLRPPHAGTLDAVGRRPDRGLERSSARSRARRPCRGVPAGIQPLALVGRRRPGRLGRVPPLDRRRGACSRPAPSSSSPPLLGPSDRRSVVPPPCSSPRCWRSRSSTGPPARSATHAWVGDRRRAPAPSPWYGPVPLAAVAVVASAALVGPRLPGADDDAARRLARPATAPAPARRSARWSTSGRAWSTSPTSSVFTVAVRPPAYWRLTVARRVRRPVWSSSGASARPTATSPGEPPDAATARSTQRVHDPAARRDLAAGRLRGRRGRRRRRRGVRWDGELGHAHRPPATSRRSDGLDYDVVSRRARLRPPSDLARASPRSCRTTSPTATSSCPPTCPRPWPAGRRGDRGRRRRPRPTTGPERCRTGSGADFDVRPGRAGRAQRQRHRGRSSFETGRGLLRAVRRHLRGHGPHPRAARPGRRRLHPGRARPERPGLLPRARRATPTPGPRSTSPAPAGCRSSRRPAGAARGRGLHRRAGASRTSARPTGRRPSRPPPRPRPPVPGSTQVPADRPRPAGREPS